MTRRSAVNDFQPRQPNIFTRQPEPRPDVQAAYAAREKGIAAALKGLDPFWEAQVLLRIKPYVTETRYFTMDDLRDVASPKDNPLEPLHPNHWSTFSVKHTGKLWRRLTERVVSKAEQGHGNSVHRYESLVYLAARRITA